MGIMTFTYFVLLMVGRRLATRDSIAVSSIMDHDEVRTVPALIRTVIIATLLIELAGAIGLYFAWQGNPAVPQDPARLMGFALFHSVSTFCNSGLSPCRGSTSFSISLSSFGMASCVIITKTSAEDFFTPIRLVPP